jgi:hypothetical protein
MLTVSGELMFTFSVNAKRDNFLLLYQPFKSFFFILLTYPLPPKRSANVEEKFYAAKQFVEISCLNPLIP